MMQLGRRLTNLEFKLFWMKGCIITKACPSCIITSITVFVAIMNFKSSQCSDNSILSLHIKVICLNMNYVRLIPMKVISFEREALKDLCLKYDVVILYQPSIAYEYTLLRECMEEFYDC